MSDQDFFFDDETEAAKPVKKEAPKKGTGTKQGQKSSAPTKGGAAKPVQKAKAPTVDVAESDGPVFTLSIVILIAIIALLAGLIGGVLIGKSLAPGVVYTQEDLGGSAPAGMGGGMGSGGTAPTLSDEELQGGMPAGHPTVDDNAAAPEEAPKK